MALSSLVTYQPAKAFWAIFALSFNVARIPLWLIWFLPASFRQNPRWTLAQAIRVRLARAFLYNISMIEIKVPCKLAPGAEKERFVTFPPARKELYTGCVTLDPEVQPVDVGGTWYPRVPSAQDKPEYVVMHFHGGAFVIGDGREQDAGYAAKNFLEQTDITHVFAPQYRLASAPNCNFPAQLQDAITSYSYLIHTLGIDPDRIIVSGDSAGANLSASLLRYISEHGAKTDLPPLTAAFLFSPWASPGLTLKDPGAMDHHPNSRADIVTPTFGCWGARCWAPTPSTGLTLMSPYLDFVGHAAFPTETPVWIQAGESERLIVDQIKMADGMRSVKGNVVELHIEKDAPHDLCLIGEMLGFDEAAKFDARLAGKFLRDKGRTQRG